MSRLRLPCAARWCVAAAERGGLCAAHRGQRAQMLHIAVSVLMTAAVLVALALFVLRGPG